MKNHSILSWIRLLLTPVLMIVLGIILLLSPDSATTLVAQIIGWVMVAVGIGFGVSAVADRFGMVGKVVAALIFCGVGTWMILHPLMLAAWIGRLVGILLVIQGIQDIVYLRSCRSSLFIPVVEAIVGAVLVVLPMTTSRLVFTVVGGVVLFIGVVMLIQRLRLRKLLNEAGEPDDPNIIDAL